MSVIEALHDVRNVMFEICSRSCSVSANHAQMAPRTRSSYRAASCRQRASKYRERSDNASLKRKRKRQRKEIKERDDETKIFSETLSKMKHNSEEEAKIPTAPPPKAWWVTKVMRCFDQGLQYYIGRLAGVKNHQIFEWGGKQT
ncbi:hypothetical protein PoB_000830000 [Plakobranchus ocellatus]|uniref:Uncharacterized protein n=1 Tax=Plakobranchus ocellatus TaxID=259542 RepID=A0AAV3YGE8_9GAST|nr:hypothetical protein PoB_000830000 [Plakobranchus ocellatus]